MSTARVFPLSPAPAPLAEAPFPAATTGRRCEVKYWASEAQAAALLRQAQAHMEIDPYCVNGAQRNTSVYFDSPHRTFFEMHRLDAPLRYKLRVRSYDDPNGPAFLEVKYKAKSTTLKQRTTVSQAIGRDVVAGRIDAVNDLPRTSALNDFVFLYHRHLVEPTLLVSTWRLALTSSDDGGRFRLTFDRDVRYQRAEGAELRGRPTGWIPIYLPERVGRPASQVWPAEPQVLIEMKYVDGMPAWVSPAVAALALRPTSFSKYIAAMSQEMMDGAMDVPGHFDDT